MPNSSPNAILKIIRGLPPTPGDTSSAEEGLDEINLLDPNGFSCDTYDIQLPGLKSNALYADSPVTDGRIPISSAWDNVKETIRLELNASTLIQMAIQLSKLAKFRQDCNDFWDTFWQIEPVYIKHQVEGEPGPRYALLYGIDIHIETPIDPGEPQRTVTLNIEREFGWRGIAPGDNPKKWTAQVQGRVFNSSNASLLSNANNLVTGGLQNRREFNAALTTITASNTLTIPAASIPGDLPALCLVEVNLTNTPNNIRRIFMSRTTKDNVLQGTTQVYANYILNAVDGSMGTDATRVADVGAPIYYVAGTRQRVRVTFGTASLTQRVLWQVGPHLDVSACRGRFMCFVRARLSASSTTVGLQLIFNYISSLVFSGITTDTVTFTGQGAGGTGTSTAWEMVYMGIVTIPPDSYRTFVSPLGVGQDDATLNLQLMASRTAGAGELYLSDVILIPIDENANMFRADYDQNTNFTPLFDTTGYFTHGVPMPTGGYSPYDGTEFRGPGLTLVPNTTNYLHFLTAQDTTTVQSSVLDHYTVNVNIVPRWAGYRTA